MRHPLRQVLYATMASSNPEGDYQTLRIASNNTRNITFHIPDEMLDIGTIELIAITEDGGSDKEIWFSSEYASIGENFQTHSEMDTSSTYDLGSAGNIVAIEVTHLFSSLEPGDFCGLRVRNRTGSDLYVLCVKVSPSIDEEN